MAEAKRRTTSDTIAADSGTVAVDAFGQAVAESDGPQAPSRITEALGSRRMLDLAATISTEKGNPDCCNLYHFLPFRSLESVGTLRWAHSLS
jgi:hypothetical protein